MRLKHTFILRNYTALQERHDNSLDRDQYEPSLHDYYSLRTRKSDGILIGDEKKESCFKRIVNSECLFNLKISLLLLFFVSGKRIIYFNLVEYKQVLS